MTSLALSTTWTGARVTEAMDVEAAYTEERSDRLLDVAASVGANDHPVHIATPPRGPEPDSLPITT